MEPSDQAMRRTMLYTDLSEDPQTCCERCHLFRPNQCGEAGTCGIFRGPVLPSGSCAAWSDGSA